MARQQNPSTTDSPPAGKADRVQPGGVLPGAEGQPAYELVPGPESGPARGHGAAVPVLIAVPHAGRAYPEALLARMRHPHEASLRLEDRLADVLGREVARQCGAPLLLAHAPRAMIDLNRAPDDMDWEMVSGPVPAGTARHAAGRRARSGLGLVPRRLQGLGDIWRGPLPVAELNQRLDLVHRPYHRTLARVLEDLRDGWGAALLLDLHSMPPLGAKTGANPAADFVIGDRYGASCAADLSLAAADHFAAHGWRAGHNRPYAGSYGLDRHGTPQRRVHAMQIEVCRTTYLDPALQAPGDGLERVAQVLAGLVRRLADELSARSASHRQAAQ